MLAFTRLDNRREAFQVHQLSPNGNPLDTTKRQVTYSTGQLRDCCLCSSYDFPQIPEHCSPTKYARVSSCSHGDVVMLFCSSFTQSERFLQTDRLIIRLQVVVVTNFIRMLMRNVFVNVFKSDAVIWWAAIFRTTSSMFDKLLHLSKSESFAMSCSRSHDLREAVGNLLTVTSNFKIRCLSSIAQACIK